MERLRLPAALLVLRALRTTGEPRRMAARLTVICMSGGVGRRVGPLHPAQRRTAGAAGAQRAAGRLQRGAAAHQHIPGRGLPAPYGSGFAPM